MCLAGAPDGDLEGPGPLAGCVTLAHSDSISLPVVHVPIPAPSPSWCAGHCKVLCAREVMPPQSLALLLLGIRLVPRGTTGVLPPHLRGQNVPGELRPLQGWATSCVRLAGRSFDLLFDVEAGG